MALGFEEAGKGTVSNYLRNIFKKKRMPKVTRKAHGEPSGELVVFSQNMQPAEGHIAKDKSRPHRSWMPTFFSCCSLPEDVSFRLCFSLPCPSSSALLSEAPSAPLYSFLLPCASCVLPFSLSLELLCTMMPPPRSGPRTPLSVLPGLPCSHSPCQL